MFGKKKEKQEKEHKEGRAYTPLACLLYTSDAADD